MTLHSLMTRGGPYDHRDIMDAIGAVLAYLAGRWYTLEYGTSDDRWYHDGMIFTEGLYARAARKEI